MASNLSDSQRVVFCQNLLTELRHARACLAKYSRVPDIDKPRYECLSPNCHYHKVTIAHIPDCKGNGVCTRRLCSESRGIFNHWKHCLDLNCVYCPPVINDLKKPQQIQRFVSDHVVPAYEKVGCERLEHNLRNQVVPESEGGVNPSDHSSPPS